MALSREEAAIIAQMEDMGENQVRLRVQSGVWPQHLVGAAHEWLKQKDQEASLRKEASQSENARIARSAQEAAWAQARAAERAAVAALAANRRATIALIISVASAIIAAFGIYWSH